MWTSSRGVVSTGPVLLLVAGLLLLPGVSETRGADVQPAAARSQVMYRLSIRFVGTETGVGWPLRRSTTTVAESTRPFAITRTTSAAGPVFRFESKLAGTLAHVGSGYEIAYELPENDCSEAATRTVGGRVAVVPLVGARQNPAPLHIEIKPKSPTATLTCVYRDGTRSTDSVHTLLPQNPRWNGMLGFVETTPVNLATRYGRAFTVEYRTSHRRVTACDYCQTRKQTTVERRYTWTLRFTPVKPPPKRTRWQVDVRGRDLWSWGSSAAGPGGRVAVDWLHRTVLEVEGDKVLSAKGKVTVLGTSSVPMPPGVFRITQKTKGHPGYTLKWARRNGRRVELNLTHDPGATYELDFTLTLTADALARLRAAGIPDPEVRYKVLVDRGPIAIHEWGSVPSRQRLVFLLKPGAQHREPDSFAEHLPCRSGTSDKDCYLTRGGEEVRVELLG